MSGAPPDEVFVFPMSFAQQRLWLLDQLEEGNPAYNIGAAVEIRGSLDESALRRSFQEIVRRHETLRTTFGIEDGSPVQVIVAEGELSLERHDLTPLAADLRQPELARLIREEVLRPFDLERGPLLRITLLQQQPDVQTLLMVMHHIISDGWSMGVLSEELGALYDAFSKGGASPLPELDVQYADYACWQREWLEGEQQGRQLEYWRRRLEGAPAHLELATDHLRPVTQSFRGGTLPIILGPRVSTALEAVCTESGATLAMVLLAAFFVLLSRFGDAVDMVVGTPVANRRRREVEGLIGCFVNTLPIRADLSADPPFRELLGQLRDTSLDAWDNQDVPFEQLVETMQPERDLSRSPLFQVMFIFQNTPGQNLAFSGLEVRPLDLEGDTAKFDLTLSLHESSDGVKGVLEFNTSLFDAGTAESIAASYQALLADVAENPERPVSMLQAVPPEQRRRLTTDLNDTVVTVPDVTVSELFEQRAAASPDAIAVCSGNEQMTYGELDARSNQLARVLLRHGVAAGVPVGVCLGRSCRTPLALLGILKAGGAFLPLDPGFPRERLAIMLEDGSAPLLVCDAATAAEGVLAELSVTQIVLDDDHGEVAKESAEKLTDPPGAGDLAYLIFTSGSTGRPKGVQVAHRALTNFLHAMAQRPGLGADDVLLAVTTISFDIAILELLLPLVQGARLVMAGSDTARDPEQLARLLDEVGATVMQATPATWRLLVTSGWPGAPGLKVLCGGEALPGDLAEALLSRADSVWNMYGPTETTIWSAVHRVHPPCATTRPQPIGRPIANTELYILDANLQPVPAGAPGELFIGGHGLALGYVGQPDLTRACFVPNPMDGAANATLYRTGDRARFRADGSIEYLGRTDHQVKLRGFRIELREIESALRAHPAVSEAAAALREGPPGEHHLAAFAALLPGGKATASELGKHLRHHLPDYMVPGRIRVVESLPLTPNGKVDRNALKHLALDPGSEELASVPPRDDLEAGIAEVWREVLGRQPTSIRESFFEVGGHSLLAVRLVSLLRHSLGVDISLATVFKHPTVEGMADAVRCGVGTGDTASLVRFDGRDGGVPFFCIPGAGGDPWYLHGLARIVGEERSFFSFRAPGLDEGLSRLTSVQALAEHYLQAVRTVQPHGPYLLGGHSFGSRVAFELAQRLLHLGQEVALLVVFDTVAPVIDNPTASWDEADHLADLAGVVSRLSGNPIEVSPAELRSIPAPDRLDTLWRRLEEGGRLPPDLGSNDLRRLIEVYTTNLGMDYIAQDVRPVPVTLLRAAEEMPWHGDRPTALTSLLAEADWGWGRLAAGEVDVATVPGDHLSIFRPPNVDGVGQLVLSALRRRIGALEGC